MGSKERKMHTPWAIAFWTWALVWVGFELMSDTIPNQWFLWLFAAFLPLELAGAIIKNRYGDTFSETLWSFAKPISKPNVPGAAKREAWARKVFIAFIGPALGARFISLKWAYLNEIPQLLLDLPFIFIGVGLTAWLFTHFLLDGDLG